MTKLEESFEISRKASDYEVTAHLRRRLDERPMVDYEIIGETIEEGEVVDVDDVQRNPSVTVRYDWLQITVEVEVDPIEGKVKTAYEVES